MKKRESLFALNAAAAAKLGAHTRHVRDYHPSDFAEGYSQAIRDLLRADSPLSYGRQVNRPDLEQALLLLDARAALRCRSRLTPEQFRALHFANPRKCDSECPGWHIHLDEDEGDVLIEYCDACWTCSGYAPTIENADAEQLPEAQEALRRERALLGVPTRAGGHVDL